MTEVEEENPKIKKKPLIQDDPEFHFRVISVLSYFTVLVVIGLPMWYFTTRVYRASFPVDKIYSYNLTENNDKEFNLPLASGYDILVTIINPDPGSLNVVLDGEHIEYGLKPVLEDLKYAADIEIKSQWLFMVDIGANFRKVRDHYALDEEQLPHIITPIEVKLSSNISPRPVLNLVLYISPCEVPLYIYNKRGEMLSTNAFYSPRWGGIFILNPDKQSCANKNFKPDINKIVAPFQYFTLKMFDLETTEPKELKRMVKNRAASMINFSRVSIRSLTELLSTIKSIVISDEIGEKIEKSLEYGDKAEQLLKENRENEAIVEARKALTYSEEAFYHHSLLTLLYFPDDQKYAVYIPLFLPVMIPVLMSLITMTKSYIIRRQTKVKEE